MKEQNKMKKLMVAFIAAAIAVVTNAAVVNWSSGGVLADSGDGTGWGKVKLAANSADYTMSILIYSTYSAGEVSDVIGSGENKGTNGKGAVVGEANTESALTAGTKYYAQATLENTVNGSTLMSQILEFTWDGSMNNPKIDFMTENGLLGANSLKSMNGEFSSTTGYWAAEGWQSVPEPTSGLLLLLGVAGLALRRRRA